MLELLATLFELFAELAFGPARLVVRGYQAPQKPPPPPRIIPAALEKKLPWPGRFATEIVLDSVFLSTSRRTVERLTRVVGTHI